MIEISSLIRHDREFLSAMDTITCAYKEDRPLPIAINGLAGGAGAVFIREAVRHALSVTGVPVTLFVGSDEERVRLAAYLNAGGVRALEYKHREPVLHNISASHDIERERLSVLSRITSGDVDAVVTTPSAALSLTMPRDVLRIMPSTSLPT